MNKTINWAQKSILDKAKKDPGCCFRLSVEWAFCKIQDKVFCPNIDGVLEEQIKYLQLSRDLKAQQTSYAVWVEKVSQNDELFINNWGKQWGGRKCTTHRDQSVTPFLKTIKKDITCVYCFYWDEGGMGGHAVVFSSLNPKAFFDPNSGLWEFANGEEMGPGIDGYITKYYKKNIKNRFVYEMS